MTFYVKITSGGERAFADLQRNLIICSRSSLTCYGNLFAVSIARQPALAGGVRLFHGKSKHKRADERLEHKNGNQPLCQNQL